MTQAYELGQILSPLLWGSVVGGIISAVRSRNARRRAAAAGEVAVPVRIGAWPTIGICVGALYALMFLSGVTTQADGSKAAHDALQAVITDQGAFQRDLGLRTQTSSVASYEGLESLLPDLQNLEREGGVLQTRMNALDRSVYGHDELDLLDSLQDLVAADLTYVGEWEAMVTDRKVDFAAAAPTLAPDAKLALNRALIDMRLAGIATLPPSIALKITTQAEADQLARTLEGQIAATRQLCAC